MSSLSKGGSNASKFSIEEGDIVQTGDGSKAYIKLDVMTSKQFNRLTFLNIGILIYAFIHVIFISTACNTVWIRSVRMQGINDQPLTLSTATPRFGIWYLCS